MGGTARAPFHLSLPLSIRWVKGGRVSLLPWQHSRIKTFTSKINGVLGSVWAARGGHVWAFQARVQVGCVLVNFAFRHSWRMDCTEQKIWWRSLCVGG